MSTPGSGDPYFYEWYVGLSKIIEMLNPDSEITSVTFQHSIYDTVDDVVVEYRSGKKQFCYQIKHEKLTSKATNLTFSKLIEKDKEAINEAFGKPALQWNLAEDNKTSVIMATNYEYGGYEQDEWEPIFAWILETYNKLQGIFKPYIEKIKKM